MQQETKTAQKSFKDTLNLPHTDFPIRANPAQEDPELLERWAKEDLFRTSFDLNQGNPKYILHDGPPYANGNIHLGHAYNKILKDIVGKSHRMSGYHVPITPGWDCHGLPIEIKVVQEQPNLPPMQLIKACREYAAKWIDVQRDEFKALGILMDWDRPYTTMSPQYEATIVRAIGILVEHGYIERKNKTVPWCPHDQTVLATAEIEHKERKDPSVYVGFDLLTDDAQRLFSDTSKPVRVIVWTTTPWTLPLNQAVLAKPGAEYVLIDLGDSFGLLSSHAADELCRLKGIEKNIQATIQAQALVGLLVRHPLVDRTVPLILEDSVSSSEGTAFVHCAPGCGPEDYEVGVKNSLDIYSPIRSDGTYSEYVKPEELIGMKVSDGQWWVLKKLDETKRLVYKGSLNHSYPHCWRCHNGLIFRATPQWFFDLQRNAIRERVLETLETIKFVPQQGHNALKATIENRWEWCISRQRAWGTPLPVLTCTSCDEAYLDYAVIEKVAQGIEKEGIEYWYNVPVEDLIDHLACKNCQGKEFKKEYDILDVWLESGVSNYAVLYNNPALSYPADIYLEGTDQYRAWFQSSLIMSVVITGKPCTKSFMSHGFTVDEKGHKMSKSLGNGVEPQEMIKLLGTDGLRLWVASIGHESDAVVSETLMKNVAEVQRKIRNTCRFLLSNLYDFDSKKHWVSSDNLHPIDQYALLRLNDINGRIIASYSEGDFTGVFHELAQYTAVELSSLYLDIVKDRLYCEGANSPARRSAQTTLFIILDTLTRLIAPIMSFTAELISDQYQPDKKRSIHLQPFIDPEKLHEFVYGSNEKVFPGIIDVQIGQLVRLSNKVEEQLKERAIETQWETLHDIRSVLLKAIEREREKGTIRHSLEASVTVYIDSAKPEFQALPDFFNALTARGFEPDALFAEFLIVSQFKRIASPDGLLSTTDQGIWALVENASGSKCPRCWKYDVTRNVDKLCHRCEEVLATT